MEDQNEDMQVEELSEGEIKEIKEKIIHNPDETKLKFYSDFRDKLREKLIKSLGEKRAKHIEYLFLLPDFFFLLARLLFDERVSKTHKAFIAGIITYIILPIDLIPDFIPYIGYIDDLAIVAFGLDYLLKHINKQIILDNWSGEGDILKLVKNTMSSVSDFLNANILGKIKIILEKFKKNEDK